MIWSDAKIKENRHYISPYNEENVQPNSYDFTLDDLIYVNGRLRHLPYKIRRGDFVLASTREYFVIPQGVCAQVDGKSTLGRMGLLIHQTAGWIDSGFQGQITLEMTAAYKPIKLIGGMRIGQIVFMDSYPCEKLYCGHYQLQVGATKPRFD